MTPAEIAALSACFSCLPDRQAALLFLLARIAGVTVDQIVAGAACFSCVPNVAAAELFLLNTIVTNGTGGGGGVGPAGPAGPAGATGATGATGASGVLCGAVPPVAAPSGSCALYYDTVSTALYYWDGAAWQLKV